MVDKPFPGDTSSYFSNIKWELYFLIRQLKTSVSVYYLKP